MKELTCVFVHDHRFKLVNHSFYSEGKITDDVLSRYVNHNDHLIILSRVEKKTNANGLSSISLRNVHFNPIIGNTFFRAFSYNLLENIIKIYSQLSNCDFIVVRSPSFLGLLVFIINLVTKKPYFVEVVGDAENALLMSSPNPSLMFKFLALLTHRVNKFFIYNASGAIYVTKNALQMRYPTKGISNHASNVEVAVKEKVLTPEDYEAPREYFKIGLIGSFNNHYKGIKEAIEAINQLHQMNYKAYLHILGSGKLQSQYEELIKDFCLEDFIHFDGRLKGGDNVIKWLKNMNLYIQPSYTEGLPRALIEAMSIGLPAIATNVGGIPELLDSKYLVPPHDSVSLANNIAKLIDSNELRYIQGERNYIKAKNYDYRYLQKVRSEFWDSARKLVKSKLK